MTRIEILYWKDIPSQVRGEDEDGRVRRILPQIYQQVIDQAAMLAGDADTDAYLAGWRAEVSESEASAQEAVDAAYDALIAEYNEERLKEMLRAYQRGPSTP